MNRLNYNGTRKLPEIFTEQEVANIVTQPLRCSNYWNKKGYAEYGKFLQMRDCCLVATIYLLGLRPNEACCLKFSDFDFRYSNVRIDGANNKCKKDRVLPLPLPLLKFIRHYLKFNRARFWRGNKYLFPSLQGSHLSAGRLKHIFREKILKPLNLYTSPEIGKVSKFRTYTLRHSRASHILKKQIKEKGSPDLYAIANILGHSDLRSTQIYLHTDEKYSDYLREQMNL